MDLNSDFRVAAYDALSSTALASPLSSTGRNMDFGKR
jgi:hypothetical protein